MRRQRYRKRKNKFEQLWEKVLENKAISFSVLGVFIALCVGAIILFSSTPAAQPASAEASPAPSEQTPAIVEQNVDEDYSDEDYKALIESGQIDEETLAGLTGEDDSTDILSGDEEVNANIIGLMIDEDSDSIADGFGNTAQEQVTAGNLDEFMVYNFSEDVNQRIQDVRSMINKGCKVIVLATGDEYFYSIATEIASDSNVYIVSVEAPSSAGYDVNITSQDSTYMQGIADFILASSQTGDVYTITDSTDYAELADAQLLGTDGYKGSLFTIDDDFETAREAAFSSSLKATLTNAAVGLNTLNYAISEDNVPSIFATTATAGIIKKWYELKNGGVSLEATPAADNADENTDDAAGDTATDEAAGDTAADNTQAAPTGQVITAPNAQLYATAQVSDSEAGEAAVSIAIKLLQGNVPTSKVFSLSGSVAITDAELATYYEQYKDEEDSTRVTVPLDQSSIDALFAEG